MSFSGKMKQIGQELKIHSPFTLLGAITGIVLMLSWRSLIGGHEQTLFAVFHPLHVALSAMVTAALFEIHRKAKNFLVILIIGITGSIGVATLSDCVLPFFGESILGVAVPTHASLHEGVHEHEEVTAVEHEEDHHAELHLGFIEEWYLVFPAAIIGVLLAYFRPATHLPHASHVLLSTWASSAHILMNTHADMSVILLIGILIVLFFSVWLPCCVSDIIFPLLFVRTDGAHIGHTCVLCGKADKENES